MNKLKENLGSITFTGAIGIVSFLAVYSVIHGFFPKGEPECTFIERVPPTAVDYGESARYVCEGMTASWLPLYAAGVVAAIFLMAIFVELFHELWR